MQRALRREFPKQFIQILLDNKGLARLKELKFQKNLFKYSWTIRDLQGGGPGEELNGES